MSSSNASAQPEGAWPAPWRRIITSHLPSGTPGAVVTQHTSLVPLNIVPHLPTAAVTPLYSSLGCPTTSTPGLTVEQITDSMTAVPGVVYPGGVNCQATALQPGVKVGMHRTNSVDYNIITEGSVWHITPGEKGEERVLVKPGEVVVQRGTLHAWEAGPEGARWICVVVAALPVEMDGKKLEEVVF